MYQRKIWFVTLETFTWMGTARAPCRQAGLLAVPRWGPGRTYADRALPRQPEATASQTPPGTFRVAGCGPLQPGTAHAFGDRIPVPDGVEGPRPDRHVPGPTECSRAHRDPDHERSTRTGHPARRTSGDQHTGLPKPPRAGQRHEQADPAPQVQGRRSSRTGPSPMLAAWRRL